jgi:hypothetical protein
MNKDDYFIKTDKTTELILHADKDFDKSPIFFNSSKLCREFHGPIKSLLFPSPEGSSLTDDDQKRQFVDHMNGVDKLWRPFSFIKYKQFEEKGTLSLNGQFMLETTNSGTGSISVGGLGYILPPCPLLQKSAYGNYSSAPFYYRYQGEVYSYPLMMSDQDFCAFRNDWILVRETVMSHIMSGTNITESVVKQYSPDKFSEKVCTSAEFKSRLSKVLTPYYMYRISSLIPFEDSRFYCRQNTSDDNRDPTKLDVKTGGTMIIQWVM